MAYGLTGAHREELKDKQLLSLRTELRSYRLNGSGMNKIVRTTSATLCSIKRRNVHVQTCNRCSDSACCRLVVDNPFSQAAISEPGVYAFYHPGDLPSASCLAKSAAYLVSRSNDTRELTDISHWD